MKKLLFMILFELVCITPAICNTIDTITAKALAKSFLLSTITRGNNLLLRSTTTQQIDLELVHQEVDSLVDSQGISEALCYVFNVKNVAGFIIISADDAITPILGYSFEGLYDNINQPPAFKEWMKKIKEEIYLVKSRVSKANSLTGLISLRSTTSNSIVNENNSTGVNPLLSTKWNQGCYYNNFCPQDASGLCGHDLVGCVAVALAQVINYWKYPVQSNGIPGYTDIYNNVLSNINPTILDWSNMSNQLSATSNTSEIKAVAELLYISGVSAKMNYGINASGAPGDNLDDALIIYFKYQPSIQHIIKGDDETKYTYLEINEILKNELDHKRPVIFSGINLERTNGHSFICDGYQNSDFFHINWGWGGYCDGYFILNNLNPANDNYNYGQDLYIGISNLPIPALKFDGCNVINDFASSGLGNFNGNAEPGESIELPITLKNVGSCSAENITAILSTSDADISISDSILSLGKLMADSTITTSSFKLKVSPSCKEKNVVLTLRIKSDEESWIRVFTIPIYQMKRISVNVAGTLSTLLTSSEKSSITSLTISGSIDARDFKTIRDNLPLLRLLDISSVTIPSYTGTQGTEKSSSTFYASNSIPQYAFYNSSTSIGKTSLTKINLPTSITTIGYGAFVKCSGLMGNFVIPTSVQSISDWAFNSCSGLTGVLSIPLSVAYIGSQAFSSCSNITKIIIPASTSSIGDYAFLNFYGSFSVNSGNTNYSSWDDVLYNKTKTTLLQCPTSKNGCHIIASTVSSIGSYSFYNCDKINSVVLPSSVTTIGASAFFNCLSMESIYIFKSSPQSISLSSNIFNLVDNVNCKLFVPLGSKSSYKSASQWGVFTNIFEMDDMMLSSNTINLKSSESITSTINIFTNKAWIANSDQLWLTISPSNGLNSSSLILKASENYEVKPRVANVAINIPSVGITQTIIITQPCSITGFIETKKDLINIYPNPSTDAFQISGLDGKAKFLLFDIYGRLLIEKQITAFESISVNKLPKGIYVVKIFTIDQIIERKILKK